MITVEYLAGFVDGEGYLGIARIRRRGRSPEYCLRICVYNTNLAILEEIRDTFGGNMSAIEQRRPFWKPSFALIWTNAAAAKIVATLAPFLTVKAEQADELLAFDARLRSTTRSRDSSGRLLPLCPRELKQRAASYDRVKVLNRTGPPARRKVNRKVVRRKRPKLTAEYLAGFVDGEGSLMITKSRRADCIGPSYNPRVAIANTRQDVLAWIKQTYGVIMTYQPARAKGWSNAYQLVWTKGTIPPLLLSIEPHLRIKRKQAQILSDFIRHRNSTKQGRNGRGFAPLPRSVVRFRENLRRRVKDLNSKGCFRNH